MKTPACLLAAALVAPALAQAPAPPEVVLFTGAPLPGAPGSNVGAIDWIGTNHGGGVIVNVASGTRDYLWGSLGGGSLGVIAEDGPIGGVTVQRFLRGCAGAGSSLVFTARLTTGETVVMHDGSVVARVGDATAPGGETWANFEEPFLDDLGRIWFRGRYSGPVNNRWGLFRGDPPQPILEPDDVVMGLPGNVNSSGGPEPGFDVSPSGGFAMGRVASVNSRVGIVRNGEVLSAGGVPLVTGNVLPAAFQLTPNEAYNVFGQVQVVDGDRWAVIGGTPSPFILRDGDMFARIGNVVDGFVLSDSFRGIALNRTGGLAWIGRVSVAGGQQKWAVFREQTLLYKEGDPVDFDGDGVADPGTEISEIPGGLGRLAYTEDGLVWARVRVRNAVGQVAWSVLAVGEPFGVAYCSSQPNSAGAGARIQAVGSDLLAVNDLRLRCVDMPTGAFGYFLCSRTQGLVPGAGGSQGDLCLRAPSRPRSLVPSRRARGPESRIRV